jgi:hypothetical protein
MSYQVITDDAGESRDHVSLKGLLLERMVYKNQWSYINYVQVTAPGAWQGPGMKGASTMT